MDRSHAQLPPVVGAGRRGSLFALTANGLAQGGLTVWGASLAGQAVGSAQDVSLGLLAGFLLMGSALAGLKWLELVGSEHLGHVYALEVRKRLLEGLPKHGKAPARGVWMLRFVTDLNGLRLWVSMGLTRLVAGVASLAAALLGLAWVAPPLAAVVGSVLVVGVGIIGLSASRLRLAEREVRKRRGRLASHAQRHLDAQADATAARILKGSERVARAAVARARLRGAIRGVADLSTWLTLGAVVVMGQQLHQAERLSQQDWVVGLTLVGLCTAPLASMVRALEYRHGYCVARENIERGLRGSEID